VLFVIIHATNVTVTLIKIVPHVMQPNFDNSMLMVHVFVSQDTLMLLEKNYAVNVIKPVKPVMGVSQLTV
jgi:hypothetical protein